MAPGAVRGPVGVAVRVTVIGVTGVTTAEAVLEFPPAFVQYKV